MGAAPENSRSSPQVRRPRGAADPSSPPCLSADVSSGSPARGQRRVAKGELPPGCLIEVVAGGCSPVNPARGQLAPLRLAADLEGGCEGGPRRPPAPSRGRRGTEKLGGTVCVWGG